MFAEIAELPTLKVNEIGEFVRFQSCLRRAKLSFNSRAEARRLPFYSRLENTLDVVLRDRGLAMEGAWERQLDGHDYVSIAHGTREVPIELQEILARFSAADADERIYAREVSVSGRIGSFRVEGRIDFVVLLWRDGRPIVRIVEGKASRKDKTYQRMQVAAYVLLARQLADRLAIDARFDFAADSVEGVVVRVDEDLREPQQILELPTQDLSSYIDDLNKLLTGDGALALAARTALDGLPFRLEPKCDACVFNVHCFPDTARQRRLQILGVGEATVRALNSAGINSVDDLADLEDEWIIGALRSDDGVSEDPLRLAARASARRKMLPGGRELEGFAVAAMPRAGSSQCPQYELAGSTLVRVYLNVDYDYVEDRIASVAAYVVATVREIQTPFAENNNGAFRPRAGAFEAVRGEGVQHPLSGRKVSQFKSTAWTGNPVEDGAAERQLLESFFQQLVEAIADVAEVNEAPLHFYVWSPSEMTRLMEGCSRGGASLIRHLSELLGCRQGQEQLIYTSLQAEVDRRFALGWTGRGLSVMANLTWFGHRFHWVRNVRGAAIELDRVFHQDIFDFASTLLTKGGEWAVDGDQEGVLQRYEVRSRFNDALSMPYYSVLWGQLDSGAARWDEEPLVRRAISRYEAVRAQPGLLRAYLETRCEALRFIEERCTKSASIEKPSFDLQALGNFVLGVDTPRAAAIDVLRIDWQVKYNEWRSAQALTSGERAASGRCLPLRNVQIDGAGLTAMLAADRVGLTNEILERRYAEGDGSFVRLLSWSGNAEEPAEFQSAVTCILDRINWRTGVVRLSPQRPMRAARYRLFNAPVGPMDFALLEQSATDYVAPRVESRLQTNDGAHVDTWFDIARPVVQAAPIPAAERLEQIERALRAWRIPGQLNAGLLDEQIAAALRGARSRIQALQGPPGTGKTATTAAAIFARAAASLAPGSVVILGGPTHRAVDTVIDRLARWEPSFRAAFIAAGVEPPPFRFLRLDPKPDAVLSPNINCESVPARVGDATALLSAPDSVTIVAGTVSGLLKFEDKLGARASLSASLLVVDEASMMVFPHLLALASLTHPDGRIMLAGDNRQLAPILSHAWDKEDRPPTIQFQPFLSAYEVAARVHASIASLPNCDELVAVDRLRHTFRLPPIQRALVATLYRARDGLELAGRDDHPGPVDVPGDSPFAPVWTEPLGLVLILHSERTSRKENALEREIVRGILDANPNAPPNSIVILSPHRGQRGLMQDEFRNRDAIAAIDTVERLQGGEAPVVIVTATASDPSQIQSAEEFLLNLNRANVAFSRAETRLVIVASDTLVDHIAADLETYEAAMLWKEVRRLCSHEIRQMEIGGYRVRVMGCGEGMEQQQAIN